MTLGRFKNGRLARSVFWAALTVIFVLAVVPHPPPVQASDKIQHMAAFATLAALGALAYAATPPLKMIAGLSLFGALIEAVQAIPAVHRDADVLDWLVDTLACGIVLIVLAWWRRRAADAR
ncbi:MAG: hypothetical protein ACJ8D5_06240 [Sphingomicrobium sp.]